MMPMPIARTSTIGRKRRRGPVQRPLSATACMPRGLNGCRASVLNGFDVAYLCRSPASRRADGAGHVRLIRKAVLGSQISEVLIAVLQCADDGFDLHAQSICGGRDSISAQETAADRLPPDAI